MKFEKGVNSYVSVEEADDYIELFYNTYAPLRIHWSVLTEEEKQKLLIRSTLQLERLPFSGQREFFDQPLAFPRRSYFISGFLTPMSYVIAYNLNGESKIPKEIYFAEIENALGLIQKEYIYNRDQNMISILGGVIEEENSDCPLTSKKAYEMLKAYIGSLRT